MCLYLSLGWGRDQASHLISSSSEREKESLTKTKRKEAVENANSRSTLSAVGDSSKLKKMSRGTHGGLNGP